MTPTLPTELWWDILYLAVHNPGLFETKWDYSPDLLIWNGWELPDPSYSESLQTKVSICQVSRSWRDIGVEFLYEHLLLTEEDVTWSGHIEDLLSTFKKHADKRGYGQSTKRVDIHGAAFYQPHFHFPTFLALLDFCHNIRIFNVFNQRYADDERQSQLSSLLQTRFSHSLRRMGFHVTPPFSETVSLPNMHLDTLELSTGPDFTIDPPLAIATVSTLCLDLFYYQDGLPSWRFPSLRHLTLRSIADSDISSIQPFLSIHGPQLHSLHLTLYEDEEQFTLLPVLLMPATTLRSLALSPIDVPWPSDENAFPSITHIAIQSDDDPEPNDIDQIVSGSSFPGLRCIRFVDSFNPEAVCIHPGCRDMWISLLEIARDRNIRIEDNDGELILIPAPDTQEHIPLNH